MIAGLPLLSVIATIILSPSFIAVIIIVVDLMFIAVVAALVT